MTSEIPTYISHLYRSETDGTWQFQSNEKHAEGVAQLAEQFAGEFGLKTWGRVLGLLHDKGKERKAFQDYIKHASGYDESIRVDDEHHHAYVGGLIAREMYGKSVDNFFVNPIVSHHRGLYDYDEMDGMLEKKTIPQEVNGHCNLPQPECPPFRSVEKQDFHHLSRMLFSCLVDADFLNTEQFMDKESAQLRERKTTLADLLPKLETFLAGLKERASDTPVNRIRDKVQQCCREAATRDKGFYSLTVPTGGGKTLSSLVWAMHHAVHHGQKRIIIAIPYTSIIVQTAAILKNIFGEENVLEHHSNVNPEDIKDEDLRNQLRLATENWDYPIIVTTNVQLFESMFSNKPSHCRKLHNIVGSVVILDEVQTLPTDYLQPIVDSLKTYNKLFAVSVLFTTASQPVLSGVIEGCNPRAGFKGIDRITEIIPKDLRLHDSLRRVQLALDPSPSTYDEIAARLCQHKRVLCIVNTRRDAKEIFKRLPDEGITLHLSRMMCPDHVAETIRKIKETLKDDREEIVRVVATQLVEAGVDIDFPVVFRQEAGLDSVLQAAGRCNREGKRGLSTTYVFSLMKEHMLPRGDINDGNNARLSLGEGRDWFAPDTMTAYFRQLYCRKDSFDNKEMKRLLYKPSELSFETAANDFRLIEDGGVSLVVCWKDSMELVAQVRERGMTYALMKKLSKYCVNVYKSDLKALKEAHAVKEELEGLYVVEQKEQYDEKLGLLVENQWEDKLLLI